MKLLILIILLVSNSFCLNVDKTWFEDTSENLEKIYTEQSKKIELLKKESNSEDKSQIEYQLLLLKKLTNVLQQENLLQLKEINKIENIDDYIKKIKEYIKNDLDLIIKQSDYNENRKKIEILDEQINKLTNKDEIQTINSQLLYAFYTIRNKQNQVIIDEYIKYQKDFRKNLLDNLKIINISNDDLLNSKLTKAQDNYLQIIKDEKKLLLSLDKAKISENETKIDSLNSEITQLKNQKLKIVDTIIFLKIEELLPYLQKKESKYFELNKNLQIFIQENELSYSSLLELLKYLSREHFGVTKTTFADTKESLFDVIKYTWTEINNPIIPIGAGISILAISKFFLIFIIGFSIATFYKKKISNATSNYLKNTSIATRTMLANLGYYFLVVITFVFGLNSVGIDLSSLTILVGALSVGIGFGLQNIVSNFISGIILIFEKSIQVGNIIEVGTDLRGTVTQINMRSSVITTFDNIDIIIPNSTLIQNNVVNLTFADDVRRLHVPFGVAYGSDADHVINTILNALSNSDLIYIKDDKDKEPKVWMTAMGMSSVDFKLLVWIHANTNKQGSNSSNLSDFLIFIYKTLEKNNIEIPFPQMDIHIKRDK